MGNEKGRRGREMFIFPFPISSLERIHLATVTRCETRMKIVNTLRVTLEGKYIFVYFLIFLAVETKVYKKARYMAVETGLWLIFVFCAT